MSERDEVRELAERTEAIWAARDEGREEARAEWRTVLEEAGVVSWTLTEANKNDPRKALADLLAWEARIALDPAVSSEARALIDKGRKQVIEEFSLNVPPVTCAVCGSLRAPSIPNCRTCEAASPLIERAEARLRGAVETTEEALGTLMGKPGILGMFRNLPEEAALIDLEGAREALIEAARVHGEACQPENCACTRKGVESVLRIRCGKHCAVPPLNARESMGGECPICYLEDALS